LNGNSVTLQAGVTFLQGFFQNFSSSNSSKSVIQFMWCRAGHIASVNM